MGKRLVDTIFLKNGLMLNLYDASCCLAGDRWLVWFLATLDVAVKAEYFSSNKAGEISFEAVRRSLGETVSYQYSKKANFVDEKKRDAVFNTLKDEFLDTILSYLSIPKFPCRLILRKYRKALGTSSLKPQ